MARRRRYNRKRRKGNFAFLYKLLAFVLICGAIGLALAVLLQKAKAPALSGLELQTKK